MTEKMKMTKMTVQKRSVVKLTKKEEKMYYENARCTLLKLCMFISSVSLPASSQPSSDNNRLPLQVLQDQDSATS